MCHRKNEQTRCRRLVVLVTNSIGHLQTLKTYLGLKRATAEFNRHMSAVAPASNLTTGPNLNKTKTQEIWL